MTSRLATVLFFLAAASVPRLTAGEPAPLMALEVEPSRVVLGGPGQSSRLLVTGVTAEGDRRDLSGEAQLEVAGEGVVRIRAGVVEQVSGHGAEEAYELVRDFSFSKNPAGPFSYERADRSAPLPLRGPISPGGGKDFPGLNQRGWQAEGSPAGLALAINPAASGTPHDLPEGTVFGHGPLRIAFTAPRDGTVDLGGGAWLPRAGARLTAPSPLGPPKGMFLSLRLEPEAGGEGRVFFDDVALPERDADQDGVEEGPTSGRPFTFEAAAALDRQEPRRLRGVAVRKGDRISLSALSTELVGLNFTVAYQAVAYQETAGPLTGEVRVRAGGLEARVPVEIRKRPLPEPVSFQNGVLAAISRQGCNQGACHAAPSGKGGFRLSLRAYDAGFDFESVVVADQGRRVNLLEPARSLLLRKPLMDVSHGGGQRLKKEDPAYGILLRWIEEGCRRDPPGSPVLERLEVVPRERTLRHPHWSQQVLALAHFSDGSVRDVTGLALYSSSEENIARVDEGGLVRGQERGEAAILVRFLEKIETVRLAYLREAPGFPLRVTEAESPPVPPASRYLDRLVEEKLEKFQILRSEPAGDGEFLRRVSLDLLGLLPPKAEAERFLADRDPEKRQKLVDALLARPEHASFWALRWGDLLRVEKRKITPAGMHRFNRWLASAWAKNLPYDRFAREILTARGSTLENPPANYYRAAVDLNDYLETSSLLFLGIRMQCAKCHNHPFERWTQDNYYGLASFFSRVRLKPGSRAEEMVVWSSREGEALHARTGKPARPWLPLSGEVRAEGDLDRRQVFVDWLVGPDNPFFARVEVNRIWGYLFGRGIVEPVDDLRDSNPPSNPALLEALAADFIRSGFDRRYLLRTILNSRTYGASSRENAFNRDDDRYFSHARTRLLTAEQILDAVCRVTGVPEKFQGLPAGLHATELPGPDPDLEFLRMFGQPERDSVCQCERSNEFSLPQALLLINGTLVQGKLRQEGNALRQLAASGRGDREIIEEVYLSALCRPPRPEELAAALEHLRRRPDRVAGIEDVVWALLNTKEFLFQH